LFGLHKQLNELKKEVFVLKIDFGVEQSSPQNLGMKENVSVRFKIHISMAFVDEFSA
jgi:hypothetical protein